MYDIRKNKFENETFDYSFTYRGVKIDVWNDDYGQQRFIRFVDDPLFGTQDIGLGSFNIGFEDDIKYIIDQKLDTIYHFEDPYFGAKLEWFQNGYGNRDIRLLYRSRMIYFWLVEDEKKVNIDNLIEESKLKLDNFIRQNIV